MIFKLVSLFFAINVAFCADHRNIFQFLSDHTEYSTLVRLIKEAGLQGTLSQSAAGSLTILAPNNAAFNALPANTLKNLEADKNKLKVTLEYHIINQTLITPMVSTGSKYPTLSGQSIIISEKNGDLVVEGAYFNDTDNIVHNGVVHGISQVLLPATENIMEYLATHDTMFSDLFAAIIVTHLEDALEGGDFTLFAPTDAAFKKISASLPGDASSLEDIIKYHIVPMVVSSSDLKDGQHLTTLAGKDLIVSIGRSNVHIGSADITFSDIKTINGLIHVIDTVQIPH